VKRVKRLALLALAMLVALSISAAPVAAKATRTAFTAMLETPYDAEEPERVWLTGGDRIQHVRGAYSKRDIIDEDGVFCGWEEVMSNSNLNFETLDGNAWGEVTLHLTGCALEGTFEAHYSGQIRTGYLDGTVVGHGSDGLEGMMFIAHFYDTNPPPEPPHLTALEGIVLDPHGG